MIDHVLRIILLLVLRIIFEILINNEHFECNDNRDVGSWKPIGLLGQFDQAEWDQFQRLVGFPNELYPLED